MWHVTDDGVLVVTDPNITELVCVNDKAKSVRFECLTPKLQLVDIEHTRITQLSPFAHCPSLTTMRACPYADSAPLMHKPMSFFQGDLNFIFGEEEVNLDEYDY